MLLGLFTRRHRKSLKRSIRAFSSNRKPAGFGWPCQPPRLPKRGTDGKKNHAAKLSRGEAWKTGIRLQENGASFLVVHNVRASYSKKTGQLRGFRKASNTALRTGKGLSTAIMFILIRQVKLDKRLDVERAAKIWGEKMPALNQLKEHTRRTKPMPVAMPKGFGKVAGTVGRGMPGACRAQFRVAGKIPAHGLIVIYDGDPGEPEQVLGGFNNTYYEHRIEVVLYMEEGNSAQRSQKFDDLLLEIGEILEDSPTLDGLVAGLSYARPETAIEPVLGGPAIKTGTLIIIAEYDAASACKFNFSWA